jgi:hypothetical protein
MNSYLYIKSANGLYTVGFYRPDGSWEAESDFESIEQAAARINYLNGGLGESLESLVRALEAISKHVSAIELELDLLRRAK